MPNFQQKPKKREVDSGAPNWRRGQFHDDNDDNQYMSEQLQYESQNTGDLYSQLVIQDKPVSKHANRRKKKKAGG